jgi:hypothetical protein
MSTREAREKLPEPGLPSPCAGPAKRMSAHCWLSCGLPSTINASVTSRPRSAVATPPNSRRRSPKLLRPPLEPSERRRAAHRITGAALMRRYGSRLSRLDRPFVNALGLLTDVRLVLDADIAVNLDRDAA